MRNALEFAKTDSDRRVIELYLTQKKVARPLIAPPGVPAERLAMLRAAVAGLAHDPAFLADAERSGLEADPISGAAVDKVVALIASTPAAVSAWRTATAEKLDASILPWTRNTRTRTRLAEMRLRPREEDVCIALLREHKMALEPAENHR